MSSIIDNKLLKKCEKFLYFVPYIFFHYIFSFIGWIMETLFCFAILGEFIPRGFLYAPICPIYGAGALILIIYLHNTKSHNNYLKLFVLFTIIFSFFEYVVGFGLDALFAARWWDYTDSLYNLNGRITLLNSLIWGVITILFVKFIYPLTEKFKEKVIYKIPKHIQIIICLVLVSMNVIDLVFSCIRYLN